MYDTGAGKEICHITYAGDRVRNGLSFSADERTLAVADFRDTASLYEVATGRLTSELKLPQKQLLRVALSPDGQSAITSTESTESSGPELQIWDLPRRVVKHRINGPVLGYPILVAYSPDSRLVITGSPGTGSTLWNVATGSEVRRLPGLFGGIAASFSADSRTLAVGANTGTVTLWDVKTGRRQPGSADPTVWVRDLRFTAGGRRLVGMSGGPVTWDVASGREIGHVADLPALTSMNALAPNGRLVAMSDGFGLRLFDAAAGRFVREISQSGPPYYYYFAFAPDGQRLVCGDSERAVDVFEVASGKKLAEITGLTSRVKILVVSPDGTRVATAGDRAGQDGDMGIGVWDIATGREVRRFTIPGWSVGGVAFSPDGRRLAAVTLLSEPGKGASGQFGVWDVATGRQLRTGKTASAGQFDCLAFAPDGASLVVGGNDGAVRLLEIATSGERHSFVGHANYVVSIALSPDGRTLATSSYEAPVYLWDVYGRSDPQQPATADNLNQCWADLAAPDAAIGFRSICRLIGAPDAAVALLRERLKPVPPPDAERVKQIIAKLDSSKFADRQSANKELDAVADRAAEQLRSALSDTKLAEMRHSLQTILDRLDAGTPETLRAVRAVEVLEQIGTPAAREYLKAVAGGAAEATLTRAAADAVKRLDSVPTGR